VQKKQRHRRIKGGQNYNTQSRRLGQRKKTPRTKLLTDFAVIDPQLDFGPGVIGSENIDITVRLDIDKLVPVRTGRGNYLLCP